MLSRRSLLLTPLALMVARAASAAGMTLAIHQNTSAGAGYRGSLEGWAKAGIRNVEITNTLLDEFLKGDSLPAARRVLTDNGLTPVSGACGVTGVFEPNPNRAAALEAFKKRCDQFVALGLTRIYSPTTTMPTQKFTDDDYKARAGNMRELGEIARGFGLTMMAEAVRASTFISTLPTLLRMTRAAAHPNMAPLLDFYHFWSGLSKLEDLDLIRPREIGHVHFQDVPDTPRELLDNTTRIIPGDGVAPLNAIVRKLADKGYAGPLSVELFLPRFQQGDPAAVAGEIRRKAEAVMRRAGVLMLFMCAFITGCSREAAPPPFHLQEATIAGIHTAITTGQTSCRAIVEAYINRARAYNGVCTSLVTEDGRPIPAATGAVRAGAPLAFPTQTVAASAVFPDLDKYAGPPLDFGRMEATASDPTVQQQAGMRVGIPNAGQVNALETFNIRGERSVACKGPFDAHPSTGPLPPGAPPECEAFRRQPDALERAAELDARYGSNPDLAALPMYCVTVAFKDPYDTKDMRSTSGNDVPFAMDAPPFDSTIAARLREKGAIIYAKATSHEFNAGPNDPGGPAKAKTNYVAGNQAVSSWSGQACNPYDTERVPRGSSSGSGAAVGANLVTVAICEQTNASCQGPASRNNATLILPTKGLLPDSGGIGNQSVIDRAGIIARTLEDGARVLDAIKDPAAGYFDSRDPFTALPESLISAQPYVQNVIRDLAGGKPIQGVRIAILREHMVTPTPNHKAISAQIDQDIKKVLRDALGAEIVETTTPGYPDDPDIPNLKYTFADAFSETLPRFMPEIFSRRTPAGALTFAVTGHQVDSYDYLLKLSRREAPLSDEIRIDNFAALAGVPNPLDFKFEMDRYLAARGDRTITNWAAWVSHARFRDDATRAAAENWVNMKTTVSAGKAGRFAVGQVVRTVLLKVMRERRRPVRACREHGADAENHGAQHRHEQSRGHHPRPADPAHCRPGWLQPGGLRAAVRAQLRQNQLHLGAAAGDAAVHARAPDADRDHVLCRTGRRARAAQGGVGLRGRDQASLSAAGVRAGRS